MQKVPGDEVRTLCRNSVGDPRAHVTVGKSCYASRAADADNLSFTFTFALEFSLSSVTTP